jgi:hypothetical protein
MRKENGKQQKAAEPIPEEIIISAEPDVAAPAAVPPGCRSRASLKTYGPIGVRYAAPPRFANQPAEPVDQTVTATNEED